VYQPINRNTSSIFDVLRDAAPLDRIVEANGSRKAPCVAHDEDDIPDMHIYEDHAHCFVCGFHGDVVDVWGKRQGIMVPFEAALDLARELHLQVPEFSEEGRRKAEEKRQQEDDYLEQAKKFHAALEKNPIMREWWEGRGFDTSLRERFLLGASSAGKASIPFWVPGGRVAGILHRKREGEPKYLLPAAEEFPDGYRPLFVPGPLGKEVFLLEGYVDGLAIAAMGKSVVVVGGDEDLRPAGRGAPEPEPLPDHDPP
jgi:DNA primase